MNSIQDSDQLLAWLTFLNADGWSAAKRKAALEVCGGIERVLEISEPQARALRISTEALTSLRKPDQAKLQADLAWFREADNRYLLTLTDEQYPERLAQASDAPVALFAIGDPARLPLPSIAVVGSRGATKPAMDFARDLAERFVQSGLTVVSGLAIGIDTAAHRGALCGPGATAAVFGCGIDVLYPRQNTALADEIVHAGGILLSEMPLGTKPLPALFPQRNRIISGLSVGVVVVEASVQSGSLVTARFAGEQGREVFAVPGSIHNPMARGCHQLIRQGAKLVESADDVLSDLALQIRGEWQSKPKFNIDDAPRETRKPSKPKPAKVLAAIPAEFAPLLDAMGYDPITMDRLVEITSSDVATLSSALMELELDGHVEAQSGGRFCRVQ